KERLTEIFKTANEVSEKSNSDPLANIAGINMEGPFISVKKKGAQNEDYIKNPDINMFNELNESCGNMIKLVTLAPELDGSLDYIREVGDKVNISVGHSDANYDCAAYAFMAGANHVTHICNAMPPFNHRNPGIIGAACDNDKVYAEVICDGIHIHPSMIRTLFKLFGKDRLVFISDSMEATGMPDGEYELGGQKVFKKGNLATLKDGTLAGSVTNLFDCMKNAVSFGIPLGAAVKCATVNPAKSIGAFPNIGSLEVGSRADILLLNPDFSIAKIY
ncbi:MAG: N-acetylglucosamine-6-phosphate deacetylase, partial [Lachnospiraceae bacterium]|nr:N-acetylglucosamine-6-phosphate deacetylase [Lachnospiraceae bacterium]